VSFDWREFLELAKGLAGWPGVNYSAEAARRSAVSRAYYAAFCWARGYAETNLGFRRTGTAEDHRLLRELFKKRKPLLASTLNRLRGWRNDCDYEDQISNLHYYVQNAIKAAGDVIRQCR